MVGFLVIYTEMNYHRTAGVLRSDGLLHYPPPLYVNVYFGQTDQNNELK
jgi:hypothetical protein